MSVNGGPGALILDADGRIVAVWALDVVAGRIAGIASIVNPDKLRHLGDVGNLTDTLRAARDQRRP
jgi:RNA polymerase sigma-70 factor (ECF subfamily)